MVKETIICCSKGEKCWISYAQQAKPPLSAICPQRWAIVPEPPISPRTEGLLSLRGGRRRDGPKVGRRQKIHNKGQAQKKENKQRVQLRRQPDQGSQCGQREETAEKVRSRIPKQQFPDTILNSFCISRVRRTLAADSCLAMKRLAVSHYKQGRGRWAAESRSLANLIRLMSSWYYLLMYSHNIYHSHWCLLM